MKHPTILPSFIAKDNLVLRSWELDEDSTLNKLVSNNMEHLRPWMSFIAQEPRTTQRHREIIDIWIKDWENGGDSVLAIEVDGVVVGSTGLHRQPEPDTLEIGYWVDKDHTRLGIATKTARLLTQVAFSVPGISTVKISHDKANTISGSIPKKLGYTFVGYRKRIPKAPAETNLSGVWHASKDIWLDTDRVLN